MSTNFINPTGTSTSAITFNNISISAINYPIQTIGNLTTTWLQAGTSVNSYQALWNNIISYDNPTATVRLPPPLEFNRYINASDLLEEFISWLKTQGVRQREVMILPLETFIKWLIIRACEEDKEEPSVQLSLPAPIRKLRCLSCGRFTAKRVQVQLCNARCAERHFKAA